MFGYGSWPQMDAHIAAFGRWPRWSRWVILLSQRLMSSTVLRRHSSSQRDPVTASEAEFGVADVLQHTAGLLDDTG